MTESHEHRPYVFSITLLSRYILATLLTVVLTLTHAPAHAQEEPSPGRIFGRVVDGETNSPLFGVSVNIVGTSLGAIANENGEYTISPVKPGTYNLRFTMIGYKTLVRTNVPGRQRSGERSLCPP